ncbi:MAG: hypothetical protein LBH20_11570 [Treponema sp.]|jgi:hypothetical protein|nr:hypothetical protein [Treponema sp.]
MFNNKKIFLAKLFLFCASVFCSAQAANDGLWQGIASPASFGKPFWADMHSTLMRIEIAYATNSPDYDMGGFNTNYRPYVFANLGADIPIWSGNFSNGKYGFSLTVPFLVDIWLDKFDGGTSPIINTSYRIGAPEVGFLYRLNLPLSVLPYFNIYNWGVKLSLYKHESTHIGDELAIYRKDMGLPITRIDVAGNCMELIFTVNDPDNQARLNHGFKFGFFILRDFERGWYKIYETEADVDVVEKSRVPFELYLQYQFQSPLFSRGFQIIASAEYRLRERYKYPFSYSGTMSNETYKESNLVNCFNFFGGIRYDNQRSNYFSKIGIGIRYYIGINPYGQFRSMPYYTQLGLALIFE